MGSRTLVTHNDESKSKISIFSWLRKELVSRLKIPLTARHGGEEYLTVVIRVVSNQSKKGREDRLSRDYNMITH
jgi:hypothetical protein